MKKKTKNEWLSEYVIFRIQYEALLAKVVPERLCGMRICDVQLFDKR